MGAISSAQPSAEQIDVVDAMQRYAAGDATAFEDLHSVLAPRVYAYLLRRTRDPELSHDLLQQTLLQVHRARCQFVPGADVLPWVLAIARHLVIDSARSAARRVHLVRDTELQDLPSHGATPDEVAHARQLASRLETGLARLPPQQREALELLKGRNLSLLEAASILRISVGALKVRVHRAQETLRALVGAFGNAK